MLNKETAITVLGV